MKYTFAALALSLFLVGCGNGPAVPFNHQPPCDQYESHVDRNLCNAKHAEG